MNYSALTQAMTRDQIHAFERNYPTPSATLRLMFGIYAVLGLFGLVCLSGGLTALAGATDGGFGGGFIQLGVAAVLFGVIILAYYGFKIQRTQAAQIQLFASQNQLQYTRAIYNPSYTGMYFNVGHKRSLANVIGSRTVVPPFEIGNVTYTIGYGKNQQRYTKGYVRIELERNLPHMVLDALDNNIKVFGSNISGLPVDFDTSQVLSLEGDFDKHFKLYAPKEYERDALYIFTPDLMALMIDNVKAFDAEVIDNQLFIYSSVKAFNLSDVATLQKVFAMINAISAKAANQTHRYADENVGDASANIVAAPGRRLKSHTSIIIIIIFSALVIFYVGAQIINVIGAVNQ